MLSPLACVPQRSGRFVALRSALSILIVQADAWAHTDPIDVDLVVSAAEQEREEGQLIAFFMQG